MAKKRDEKPRSSEPAADEPDDFAGAIVADESGGADEGPAAKVTRSAATADRGKEEKAPPPFGTARPAGAGKLPRVVNELERAGDGETRFKIACRNYAPQKVRYVLADAGDEDGAVKCYLAANGLDKHLAKLRGRAPEGETVEPPELVVTELPD